MKFKFYIFYHIFITTAELRLLFNFNNSAYATEVMICFLVINFRS